MHIPPLPLKLASRLALFGSLLLLYALGSGCRVVQDTTAIPAKAVQTVTRGAKDQPQVDPVQLQQQLIRFADEFISSIATASEQLRRGTNALDRIELEKRRLLYANDILGIASGQNSVANLLDMVVLTTMTRIAMEEYWMPKVYGESARPLFEVCRNAEQKIWKLAGPVLKPAQAEELRQAIRTSYATLPDPQLASHMRAVGLADQMGAPKEVGGKERPASVFSLLQIDPLAGLDPAAREIAQTRLLAERALFVTQRMPFMLRWQSEMFTYQLAATPEVSEVLTNLDRFGQTAAALTRTIDQLPKLVNDQREAAIKQTFDGLAAERTNLIATLANDDIKLRPTLMETRQTLDSANELAKSLDAAVKSLDTFMVRFDKGTNAPPPEPATNARPFDILDYATTAKEVTTTIRELNTTITSLDKAVPQIQNASQSFEDSGKRLLMRFFLFGAGLIAFFLVGIFLGAIIYRRFTNRVSSAAAVSFPESSGTRA